MIKAEKPNRLINEKSPYLLQHAHNPVDWFPWSDEAFEKAAKEDKPIFLSIGYATCHWCHVMEKESFEDNEIAGLMNDTFVSIKVDREERPDVDSVYMTVCQMLTGTGGWPLTIVMTPDKQPFFAGTYFPKTSRYQRVGMKELVPQIKKLWMRKRDEVLKSAKEITGYLSIPEDMPEENIDKEIFNTAFNELSSRFDSDFGGFGQAPKFPTPHNLLFSLRYWLRTKDKSALEMVEKTLIELRKGGIFDHLGFGFHRYSTDRKWLVPHFEKMLYDQALILEAYIEAYQITKKEIYKNTIEEILEYVLRDMKSAKGGFYSAEDADSEGEEGKFYTWSSHEINKILDAEEAEFAAKVFNIKDDGNFVDPFHEDGGNLNIPHLSKTAKEQAQEFNINEEDFRKKLSDVRKKLFEHREKRIHPFKDDKILTDWNGLMISALSKAYQVLNDKTYLDAAIECVSFIEKNMFDSTRRLLHRYRENEAAIFGNLDDYAFYIAGLIDLYEASFEFSYLNRADELTKDLLAHFWDDEKGGFYFTADYAEKLIVRQKEIYDGAIPSGNSVVLMNLLRLSRFTANTEYEEKAWKLAKYFYRHVKKTPSAFSRFLTGLDFALNSSTEIIFCGDLKDEELQKLIGIVREKFIPNKAIIYKPSKVENEMIELIPFIVNYESGKGKPTVYVCENYQCNLPVTNEGDLRRILGEYF